MGDRFEQATREHYIIDSCARGLPDAARALYNTLIGEPSDHLQDRCNDLRETIPTDFLNIFATDNVACSFAFAFLWRPFFNKEEFPSGLGLREKFREAFTKFGEQVAAQKSLQEGFGWDNSLGWKNFSDVNASEIDVEAAIRIAKLAGAMLSALKGKEEKDILNTPAEITSITVGSDIGKLLPSEKSYFLNPDLENLILYRIATNSAGVYQTKGKQPRDKKGPLVFCVDESGSMHEHRREWACAAIIALSRIAKEEKRQVGVVHFSTSIYTEDFDPSSPKDVAKLISSHLGGGTDIARAIRSGINKVLEINFKTKARSDLILITDGIDHGLDIPNAVEALLKVAKLFTIAIDVPISEENCLRKNATEYGYLSDRKLSDPSSVLALKKAVK